MKCEHKLKILGDQILRNPKLTCLIYMSSTVKSVNNILYSNVKKSFHYEKLLKVQYHP